jgi:hypothetical protein
LTAMGGFLPVRLLARKCRDRTFGSRPDLAESGLAAFGGRGVEADVRNALGVVSV